MDASAQYALAYSLSSISGLRGFLVLFLAATAAHFGVLHPNHTFAWLGSTSALGVLGAATMIEFIADKIPAVDNAMHALQSISKPIAGAIVAGSVIPGQTDVMTYVLMAAGATNALAIHGAVAGVRAGSTVGSFGTLNPVLSVVEDVLALGGTAFAFVAPFAAAIVAVLAFVAVVLIARWFWMRRRSRVQAPL
jgi:hypothetical protein